MSELNGSPEHVAVIDKLYEGVKPEGLAITSRNAEDYRRIFGLEQVPLKPDAKVLDIGSGKATISAQDFGLRGENLVRADLFPNQPGIEEANILQLKYEEGSFDETWAMFVLKYLEARIPHNVEEQFRHAVESSGTQLSSYVLTENLATFLGLKAVSEMLRVTAQNGRVRLASYYYDFKQSGSIKSLLTGMMHDKVPGLKIGATEVPYYGTNPEERDVNLFLEKGAGYDQKKVDAYVEEEYKRLIPPEVAQILIQ